MSVKQVNKTNKIQKVLIIQTAFIGDVILATALIEKLHGSLPETKIDFLLRKGNEVLLQGNPHISDVLIWDKSRKYMDLARIIRKVRKNKYDLVINVQRFFATGLITILSGAKLKAGFRKNPLSSFFDIKAEHPFDETADIHEIERNQKLITFLVGNEPSKPRLFFTQATLDAVKRYQIGPYICVAPASVWQTKQFPEEKWVELLRKVDPENNVFLIGDTGDIALCETVRRQISGKKVINLAGKLDLSETAALIEKTRMVFVNDSAPLHMGSATNTPTCAVFCSTVPQFGFKPLSDISVVVEVEELLVCRPCGMHGLNICPEGHFKCAKNIDVGKIATSVNDKLEGIFKD